MAFFLRPLKPDSSGSESFHIPPDATVLRVGRGAGNELRLEDRSISSLHARIEASGPGRFDVVDCGSSNGTFVNGSRVERHPLAEGDLVRFATVEFRVQGTEGAVKPEDGEVSRREEVSREGGNEPGHDGVGASEELERLREELAELRDALGRREAEVAAASARLEEETRRVRRLERELDEAAEREERLQTGLSEARRETLDRDGRLSALRYERGVLEGRLAQSEAERSRLAAVCEGHELALREGEERLSAETAALVEAVEARETADGARDAVLARLRALADRLLEDWRAWFEDGEAAPSDAADEEGVFARIESVAARIREELDRIEPVWLEFCGRVQDELAARCEDLRTGRNELEGELRRRRDELDFLKRELAVFPGLLEAEVRRAQGLSRRGLEVEIPARVEAMVAPKDRELELCRSLLLRIEALDRLRSGHWRSWRLREVHRELREFRDGLFDLLLASCGVRPFEVETGTFLGWSHRDEVQVLGRKGWGTREFEEQPFRPGEVVAVVRPGYRIGEGELSTVLRKVEVLIRERGDGR